MTKGRVATDRYSVRPSVKECVEGTMDLVSDPRLPSMVECIFFFQAEDGIRDYKVTGVQTCALPIFLQGVHRGLNPAPALMLFAGVGSVQVIRNLSSAHTADGGAVEELRTDTRYVAAEIGRASCRERV